MTGLERALAYLEKLPSAISGSGGSRTTYLAGLACRRLGLSEGEIRQALAWYSENRCQPPWSERELEHKLASVLKIQITRPLAQSFGRKPAIKPVTAAELADLSARRRARKVKPAPVTATRPPAACIGEPPEAPPPLDDSETRTAEYWGWPPIGAPHAQH